MGWPAYFKYPEDIRRVIYTTNAVEAVHRQFRKLTKTKGVFPNENSLLKLLYLGIENASKKWNMSFRDWGQTLSQLAIFFEGRLDDVIELWCYQNRLNWKWHKILNSTAAADTSKKDIERVFNIIARTWRSCVATSKYSLFNTNPLASQSTQPMAR